LGLILAILSVSVDCKKTEPVPKTTTIEFPVVQPMAANAVPVVAWTNAASVVLPMATNSPALESPAPVVAPVTGSNQPPQLPLIPNPTPQPTLPPTPFATGGSLRVLALPGHFPDWLKTSLEEKLKTKIEVQTYATPEEAVADLTMPNAHFDLALIADRIVPDLIQGKVLRLLPVTCGVKPDHLYLGHDHIDRDNHFAWPYAWNLVELAYNSAEVKTAPQHWIDLASPEKAREAFFADGLSVKALDEKGRHWAEVKHLAGAGGSDALQSRPLPEAAEAEAVFRIDGYGPLHHVLAGQMNWKYVLPEEGSIIFLYHLVLPASGMNPAVADTAVALFMDPANTARLASENGLAVTQKEALPLVPAELAHDPLLYPPLPVMNRCSFAKP